MDAACGRCDLAVGVEGQGVGTGSQRVDLAAEVIESGGELIGGEGSRHQLLHGCDVHGRFDGPHMRSLLQFAAYTGLRAGELFALEVGDVDLANKRVHVQHRVHRGRLALPKSNKTRVVAVPPPARDAILRIDMVQADGLVFQSKSGKRLSQPTMSYWGKVKAAAGLDFDFYAATKHRAVHHLYVELGLPAHVVAAQMGWGLKSTIAMLEIYSHHRVGALEAIDSAFEQKVTSSFGR